MIFLSWQIRGSGWFQFHMFHRVHESFFCAGCITCAAPKSCSSPVRCQAIRLSGFSGWSGWMACPVSCSFSGNAATLFPSFFPWKNGSSWWFCCWTCWIGMSVLTAFSFGRAYPHGSAAPRSVLFEQLKPSTPLESVGFPSKTPLNLLVFPAKFKFPTCRKRMHHQSLIEVPHLLLRCSMFYMSFVMSTLD